MTWAVWCLVGNLVGVRGRDERGGGTRHIAFGAKLHCLPPLSCGDGFASVRVVVKSRCGRWIRIRLAAKKITNWRAELVRNPTAIRMIDGDSWNRERAEHYAESLNSNLCPFIGEP